MGDETTAPFRRAELCVKRFQLFCFFVLLRVLKTRNYRRYLRHSTQSIDDETREA